MKKVNVILIILISVILFVSCKDEMKQKMNDLVYEYNKGDICANSENFENVVLKLNQIASETGVDIAEGCENLRIKYDEFYQSTNADQRRTDDDCLEILSDLDALIQKVRIESGYGKINY